MKKQVYEIDENNLYKRPHLANFDELGNCLEELEENIIAIDIPNGLYKAKWNGTKWIETLTQEEIKVLNNVTKVPTEQELLNAQILLENANMKKQVAEQQALNANLLLDVAKLKGGI